MFLPFWIIIIIFAYVIHLFFFLWLCSFIIIIICWFEKSLIGKLAHLSGISIIADDPLWSDMKKNSWWCFAFFHYLLGLCRWYVFILEKCEQSRIYNLCLWNLKINAYLNPEITQIGILMYIFWIFSCANLYEVVWHMYFYRSGFFLHISLMACFLHTTFALSS